MALNIVIRFLLLVHNFKADDYLKSSKRINRVVDFKRKKHHSLIGTVGIVDHNIFFMYFNNRLTVR